MPRPILPFTMLLTAVTALVLVGAAIILRPTSVPVEADGSGESSQRALAFAFYDAANAAIETGDLTSLAPLVTPELLDGDSPQPDESGGVTLGRRVHALHAFSPALRLVVEELAVDGELVIAHVRAECSVAPVFLGLRLTEAPEPWGSIDILRIVNDRVVEHRTPAAGSTLLESAVARSWDLLPNVRLVVTARRISLAAEARHDGAAVDWLRLLYVERGVVSVTIAETGLHPASTKELRPTGYAIVPGGVGYEIQNEENEPASLLDLRADRVVGPTPTSDPSPATTGVVASGPARIHITGTSSGAVALSLGRATLAPGARLVWADGTGPVLFFVEAGTAHLDADPDVPWMLDGATNRAIAVGDGHLEANTGVVVPANRAVALTAGTDAPATLLIVTLLPADAAKSVATPCG